MTEISNIIVLGRLYEKYNEFSDVTIGRYIVHEFLQLINNIFELTIVI
jgi:hypothetical protein